MDLLPRKAEAIVDAILKDLGPDEAALLALTGTRDKWVAMTTELLWAQSETDDVQSFFLKYPQLPGYVEEWKAKLVELMLRPLPLSVSLGPESGACHYCREPNRLLLRIHGKGLSRQQQADLAAALQGWWGERIDQGSAADEWTFYSDNSSPHEISLIRWEWA